jgi:TniB protein
MAFPDRNVPFLALREVMNRDYRERMVTRACEHYRYAAADLQQKVGNVFNQRLRVDGFKNAARAPIERIRKQAVARLPYDQQLSAAIIDLWIAANPELESYCRCFCDKTNVALKEVFSQEGKRIEGWTAEMQGFICLLKDQHSQYDENDIGLMLSCILEESLTRLNETDNYIASDEIEMTVTENNCDELIGTSEYETECSCSRMFEQWLNKLAALPASAPEWREAAEFAAAVQRLAEEKRGQREQHRARLQFAIDALTSSALDSLDYFGIADCSSWQSDLCPLDTAETTASSVAELHSALEGHAQLRTQKATTLLADRARLEEMSRLEERILLLHQQLAATFTSAAPNEVTIQPPRINEAALDCQPNDGSRAHELTSTTDILTALTSEIELPDCPEPDILVSRSVTLAADDGDKLSEQATTVEAEFESLSMATAEIDALSPEVNFVIRPVSQPHGLAARETLPWDGLLWSLLEKNDAAGAYWLSYALGVAGQHCAIDNRLLAALCGGPMLPFDSYLLAQDLAELVLTYQCAQPDPPLTLLEIAAGLRPALIAPNIGMQEWLHITHLSQSLNILTTAVKDFAAFGHPFQRHAFEHLPELNSRTMSDIAAEARQWLADAPSRRNKNKAASDVWRKLIGVQGDLWQMLDPIGSNRRQDEGKVFQMLRSLENHDLLMRRISELHADIVHGKKAQQIEGAPQQQLVRDIQEACRIAKRWCAAIERAGEAQNDWLATQTANLRALAHESLPMAEHELQELASSHQVGNDVAAAAHCLLHALRQLRPLFLLPSKDPDESIHRLNDTPKLVDASLAKLLARRLLSIPELCLNDDGQPEVRDPIEIARAIEQAAKEDRTPETAFGILLQGQDYRFAKTLLTMIPNKERVEELEQALKDALIDSRSLLSAKTVEVLETVEQAVVDGVISDVQRAEYSAEIEGIDTDGLLDFRRVIGRLDEIKQRLAEARERRLSYLNDKWLTMEAAVSERLGADKFAQASAFVRAALERRDTRVIDECLAQIREALEGGGELDESWFAAMQKRDALVMFLAAAPEIEAWLQRSDGGLSLLPKLFAGGSIGDWRIGDLPRGRRQEAGAVLQAWTHLHEGKPRAQDAELKLAETLRFLGFTSIGATAEIEIVIDQRGTGWLHARALASSSDLARPIPQFGSLAAGIYDLVCFWGRPSTDLIGARLHEARLAGKSLLVFYFGPLSLKERTELARLAGIRELNLVVLDDVLLTFLVGEKDARLPTLLRCTLSFSSVDPYTPFQAGNVPPEMYFGREEMERELRNPRGSCLVYGGRQLGKSALLHQAQRRFHQPEQEQFAVVEDIKMIGDAQSGQPTDAIWHRILEGFVRLGLMKRMINKPDEIRSALRGMMRQSPNRFILMMLDEADNFLDADAADGFRVVNDLRTLMSVTDRRFKVVFAGLQNVQRFHGIPNQPLAHFGKPISIGPLEPKAGQALVREPFETLGFRFTDDATVLRILSYTNYHAGLIQIFCQELLRRLRSRLGGIAPPYLIRRDDVEGVYRSRDVRDCIRERFDWTLALNPGYQAVAWTMIADQMRDHDSYARPYPAAEIKRLVNFWWSQGFDNISSDHLRGLLDEMCGLGVLIRDSSGCYRLRSPNLVRLMGTETDIESRLIELSERTPEVKYDADSHHARLDESGAIYSPLTYAQERLLNPPQFGVGLIFASKALDLAELEPTVKRFIPTDLPTEVQSEFTIVPNHIANGAEMETWLRKFLEARPKHERLVVYQQISGCAADALARVRESVRFCRSRRSQKQWLRVIFQFNADASWQWMLLPMIERNAMEEEVDATVVVRRWNLPGVRQRLSQSNKIYSDEVCQAVLRATGGWPWLLNLLFNRCGHDDPRSCAATLARELADPNNHLSRQWRGVLTLGEDHVPTKVLRFISQWQEEAGVPREWVTAEEIGASKEECDAAVELLLRMSLLDARDKSLCVEPITQMMLTAVH